MADVVGDGTGLGLVPLVPVHVPEQHKVYSDQLVSLLEDDERRKRVWNIALTGGYGSGESSVLTGVRERLASRVVEISLSSLSDVGVQPFDRQSNELTDYIQKEIVKQQLYRERPISVPADQPVAHAPRSCDFGTRRRVGGRSVLGDWLGRSTPTGGGCGVVAASDDSDCDRAARRYWHAT
ncbi:hypothetical protein [Microbacterium sp. CIAB417]|uniref:YobI family P-loop NTPase n=1 Tax=Microbacterium sp. CIAB417 TaxID=2860287 RepID=UPI001FAC04B0|nr:hypothetical protein [Microbacterium sp. CIAB417]